MTSVDDLIDEPESLPEDTVELCLRGRLQRDFEVLSEQLAQARQADAGKLNQGPETRRLAQEMETLRQQMLASMVTFRLRAMPRPAWRALLRQHPPRRDDAGGLLQEDSLGFNADTFPPELIQACTYEPVLSGERWKRLLDEKLTPHQFDELFSTAYRLNRGQVSVPFSLAASEILKNSPPA